MRMNWVENKTKGQLSKSLIIQCQLVLVMTVLTQVLAVHVLALALVQTEAALVNVEPMVLIDICHQRS